ncbi:MAG: hypothetical protein RR444_06530, partial [Oscillospiraceae bacterium]
TVSVALTSDNYVQAFLIKSGISSFGIGMYGFFMQIFAMIAYFFLLGISPKKKGFKRKYLWSSMLLCAFPIGLILSNSIGSQKIATLLIATVAGVIFSVFLAYKNTCEYSMVSYIFEKEYYGVVLGKGGVLGGLLAFAITGFSSRLLGKLGFPMGYYFIFLVAALIFIVSALFIINLKLHLPNHEEFIEKGPSINSLLRTMLTKEYLMRLFPHFLRGMGSSGIYFFMTIAMSCIDLTENQIAVAVAIGVASITVSNLLFVFAIKYISVSRIVWSTNLVCGICMVVTTLNSNLYVFYILYGMLMFFYTLSQLSIPTGVLHSTKTEDMPAISAMRMLLTSAASSLFILLYGSLLKIIPAIYIMLFAATIFIICGYCYKKQFETASNSNF